MRTTIVLSLLALVGCSADVATQDSQSLTTIEFEYVVFPSEPSSDVGCLPKLPIESDCSLRCVVLVAYPMQTDQAAGCTDPGMSQPDPATLARFVAEHKTNEVVCAYDQLVGGSGSSVALTSGCQNSNGAYQGATCQGDPTANGGWCIVEGNAIAGGCGQAIQYAGGGPPTGARVSFQCIVSE